MEGILSELDLFGVMLCFFSSYCYVCLSSIDALFFRVPSRILSKNFHLLPCSTFFCFFYILVGVSDAVGRPCAPLPILILGVLHVLGRHCNSTICTSSRASVSKSIMLFSMHFVLVGPSQNTLNWFAHLEMKMNFVKLSANSKWLSAMVVVVQLTLYTYGGTAARPP